MTNQDFLLSNEQIKYITVIMNEGTKENGSMDREFPESY